MPTASPCLLYEGTRYEVGASVGHHVFRLMMSMKRDIDARMVEHGLTDAQWKPLWMLRMGRASTAIELAREVQVDTGAITRMVDRLEAKALLERVRSETDRRVVHLRLTAAGEAAADQVPHVLAAVNNDFLRGFDEAECKQLCALLERMTTNGAALQNGSVARSAASAATP